MDPSGDPCVSCGSVLRETSIGIHKQNNTVNISYVTLKAGGYSLDHVLTIAGRGKQTQFPGFHSSSNKPRQRKNNSGRIPRTVKRASGFRPTSSTIALTT